MPLVFCSRAGGRDVDAERGGVRDVEALDRARKIEPRNEVAGLPRQVPQALAFRAEHERERQAERRRGEIDRTLAVEAYQQESRLAQLRERARKILHDRDRYV